MIVSSPCQSSMRTGDSVKWMHEGPENPAHAMCTPPPHKPSTSHCSSYLLAGVSLEECEEEEEALVPRHDTVALRREYEPCLE